MNALSRLWNGELALAEAFWTWAVLGGLLVNLTTSGLFLAAMTADRTVLAFVLGYAISVPYNVAATVGVWRSAGHYPGSRHWADLARAVTVVGMLLLSLT